MNFEANKIAGAVLGTALGVMAVGIVAEMIYAPPHDHEPGYVIAVAEPGDGGTDAGGQPPAAEVPPIAVRLETASVEAGENSAKKCAACHTFDKGGQPKVGPNLWDVVGANVIHEEGFNYSPAMQAKGQEGMTWTFENLDQFLTNPKGFIPGTAMAFAGLKKPDERANVIAYLRTLSDNPVPLPAPPAPTAEAPPADGAPAATPPAAEAAPPSPAPSPEAAPAPAPATGEEAPAAGGGGGSGGGASSGDSGGAGPALAPAAEAEPPAGPAPEAAPQ
jgi:cytochrome c